MADIEQQRRQSHPRLILVAIGLMIVVGAIIIFFDRNQVKQLAGKVEWIYVTIALGCVAVSYLLGSLSMVVISRAFGIELNKYNLLRLGFVSSVLSSLIALPAALALKLLVLERYNVPPNQTIGSTLFLAYFKNFVFLILIPISLVYIIFTYPLVFGGAAIMVLIIVIIVIAIAIATLAIFDNRVRTFSLKITGHIWHFVTRKDIAAPLNNFGATLTQGIKEMKQKRKFGILLAGLVIGDVAVMIASLFFCFKALGIPVHIGVLITGFNFGITLTVISFIPGDIGVQEASIAGVLAIFGVPFSQGVLGAILFRVIYYFVPFIFSLGFYWSLLKETKSKTKSTLNSY
jgi:uncharacterized protein (TIRG00374 family)